MIIIAVLSVLALSACSQLGIGAEPTPTAEPLVEDFTPVVSATGAVVPLRWSTLSMTTGGVVEALNVEEGQQVQAGEVLVRLKGSERIQAEISAAELAVLSAQQGLDDLYQQADQARAAAQLRLANAQEAHDEAVKRRTWRNYRVGSDEQIDRARADLIIAEDAVEKAEEAFNGVSDRDSEDLLRAQTLSALSAARQARDRAESNLNYLLSMPDEIDLAQADAEVEVARAELEDAQQAYDRLKDGPDPDDVQLLETGLANAQAQLKAAESALDDLQLEAPFAGTVSKLFLRADEWVTPGQPVLTLADLNTLRVETTDLSEIDVSQVQVGDTALVTFDALPGVEVQGVVVHIPPKAAEGSGVNYNAVIELETVPEALRWGMTGFVDIQIEAE
jgi:multidrug resistance efflux pump